MLFHTRRIVGGTANAASSEHSEQVTQRSEERAAHNVPRRTATPLGLLLWCSKPKYSPLLFPRLPILQHALHTNVVNWHLLPFLLPFV